MDFFCRQQRKARPQVIAHLTPKNRDGSRAGAIVAPFAVVEHILEQFVILAHLVEKLLGARGGVKPKRVSGVVPRLITKSRVAEFTNKGSATKRRLHAVRCIYLMAQCEASCYGSEHPMRLLLIIDQTLTRFRP